MMTPRVRPLPQFIPTGECLSCEGCCRFHDEKTDWRPRVGQEELSVNQATSVKSNNELVVDKDQCLATIKEGDFWRCIFLDTAKNLCQAYFHRPFECQLYPFLLIRQENKFCIGVHLSCPYAQKTRGESQFEKYVSVLKSFLNETEVLSFLQRNLFLFADYSSFSNEIEIVFSLPLSNQET